MPTKQKLKNNILKNCYKMFNSETYCSKTKKNVYQGCGAGGLPLVLFTATFQPIV